jgi:hypothetical protein
MEMMVRAITTPMLKTLVLRKKLLLGMTWQLDRAMWLAMRVGLVMLQMPPMKLQCLSFCHLQRCRRRHYPQQCPRMVMVVVVAMVPTWQTPSLSQCLGPVLPSAQMTSSARLSVS